MVAATGGVSLCIIRRAGGGVWKRGLGRGRASRVAEPAAYEVYDLNPITFRERGLFPARAPHDLAVQLDRQPLGRDRELADETADGRPLLHLTRLAVNLDTHGRPHAWRTARRSSAA